MVTEITTCRLCHDKRLTALLDFGSTPLANAYLNPADFEIPEIYAPLKVVICDSCNCVQLKHTVDPFILFNNYQYESSSSGNLAKHFEKYAADLFVNNYLKKGDFIIDIGGNDGVLLRPLKHMGANVLNIEPAANLVRKCQEQGIPAYNAFFNKEVAAVIARDYPHPAVITCNNCFAHVPTLDSIVDGLDILMGNDTVFAFENSYLLDVVNKNLFDVQYHEHTMTHGIKPLFNYFRRRGWTLFDVKRNNNQGGSFRAFVKKGIFTPYQNVINLILTEDLEGIYSPSTYDNLSKDINEKRIKLNKALRNAKSMGLKIAAYGAPAKFTTFCYALGLDGTMIDFVIEDAQNKIGKLTPGTRIPIYSSQHLYKENPDIILITAWNFAEHIINNHPSFKGKFLVPFPEITIK